MKSKYGISLKIPRSKDLRFKLTVKQIQKLKEFRKHNSTLETSKKFNVSRSTVYYYTNEKIREMMIKKNAKHRKVWTDKDNEIKQRRRNIVRDKVREYTKLQVRQYRINKKNDKGREIKNVN